jgi:hypothetical protein
MPLKECDNMAVTKKTTIPVIFAGVGLVCTIYGMFGHVPNLLWTGVGMWVASILSSKLLKGKSKTGQ